MNRAVVDKLILIIFGCIPSGLYFEVFVKQGTISSAFRFFVHFQKLCFVSWCTWQKNHNIYKITSNAVHRKKLQALADSEQRKSIELKAPELLNSQPFNELA